MKATLRGVVRGHTIELPHATGLPDGEPVNVILETIPPPTLPPGEGLRLSAGGWAEGAAELDEYLEWNRQQRKQGRAGLDP